jgi:hypothetical protein
MEPTVRSARAQSGIAAALAQEPDNGRPKAEIGGTFTKNKGKQKRPLWSWESEDIASIPMELLRTEQSLILWYLSGSLLLSGCEGAGPECGSLDTRNSVVKIVSDDTNNKLVNYAVKNSNSVAAIVGDTKSEAEKLGILEKARQGAVYRLDDTILMNSRNRAAQEVTCIGLLYVTVADATAQKEIEFKVKQTADGNIIVSVNPFLF